MVIRKVRRLAWAALGLVLLLLLLECLTRVADRLVYGAPVLQNYDEDSLFTYDALGKRGRPFARYLKWQLNGLGYRGPEVDPSKIHMICIGSSETFGLYEAPDGEYPRQLEHMLHDSPGGYAYQIVNVAFPGETLNTARVRIPDIVTTLHPRYALLYPSVCFYIWLPWAVHTNPTAAKQVGDGHFKWRIAEEAREEVKTFLPPVIQNWLRELQIRWKAPQFGAEMERVPDQNVAQLKKDLVLLLEQLRSLGVRPVLVTHASRFDTHLAPEDRYWLTAWRKEWPMLREDGFLDAERRMNQGIREVASEQGVLLIDAAKKMPRGGTYFADYQHFTTVGAHAMAEILAAGLSPVLQSQNQKDSGPVTLAYTSSRGGASARPNSLHTP